MEENKKGEGGQLSKLVETRVSASKYKELTELLERSENRKMSELIRDILYNRPVIIVTRNETAMTIISSLSALRYELNRIGNNVNQVTRFFNASRDFEQRLFNAMEVSKQLKDVGGYLGKVEDEIEKLGELWSQK